MSKIVVSIAVTGMEERRVYEVAEIRPIKRWPAVRLAVRRTPSATGRIRRLTVSIMTSAGIRAGGVPSGRKWLRVAEGWSRAPRITVASQKGAARPRLKESWVAGVKIKGRRPSIFEMDRNRKRERKMAAHL